MSDLHLDNLPCELYFFEGIFVQYDTQKGEIHEFFHLVKGKAPIGAFPFGTIFYLCSTQYAARAW